MEYIYVNRCRENRITNKNLWKIDGFLKLLTI